MTFQWTSAAKALHRVTEKVLQKSLEKTFRELRNTQLTLRTNAQTDNIIDNKTDFTESVFFFYIF